MTHSRTASRAVHLSRRVEWIPPEMYREGLTPLDLEILIDTARRPLQRRVPGYLMQDRAREKLAAMGLLRWHRTQRGVASLGDYYVLTPAGTALVRRYGRAVQSLGRSRRKAGR